MAFRRPITCLLFLLLGLVGLAGARAQGRVQYTIATDWLYQKGTGADLVKNPPPAASWEKISLPHTWNATDALDDVPGYYRGVGWYKKLLVVPAAARSGPVYLHFGAANQLADVYVNGQLAGHHTGGYTAFRVPIAKLLKPDPAAANEVIIKVDNSYNADVPPLSADFTFYGGIYRDVQLLEAGPVHFALDNNATSGVFVSTPAVSALAAEVLVRGTVVNESQVTRKLLIVNALLGQDGREVARQQTRATLAAGKSLAFRHAFKNLRQPHLWSPADPYLYRVVSTVREADGERVLDEVANPLGFRWFRFDAAQGFYLNGQPLKLIGANRHQDYPGRGNALPEAQHVRDIELLKAMGANFLRISHYPQDPAVLAACDRLGIMASVEIPIVNAITETPAFTSNCLAMQTEMIRQNYNHPSLIIWAYMNEVLITKGGWRQDAPDAARELPYLRHVAALAQQLEDLTRREDPSRYTMMSNHNNFDLYHDTGLTSIPMLIGWNLYQGWYSPALTDLPAFLERHHRELPAKPMLITEYGADADERLHSFQPLRFDKVQEYANELHQYYLAQIEKYPFVAGSALWNFVEFNAEGRQEATPHLNTKGVLTADRRPKDPYYLYQAHLLQAPLVRIGSRGWRLRSGVAAAPDSLFCPHPVEVYTNQPAVRLALNGRDLGTRPAVAGVAHFRVPFADGLNRLAASGVGEGLAPTASPLATDVADIEFLLVPADLHSTRLPFKELNVSLGDQRYFTDEPLHQVWLPEQEYRPGSWGYVGGQVFHMKNNDRLPYGSDRNILGSGYDAVLATQRVGLRQFRLDVPDGEYEVTLHFAELENAPPAEKLLYNLEASAATTAAPGSTASRVFDVLLNGQPILVGLGRQLPLPPVAPASFRVPVTVRQGKGIVLDFRALAGETILNGLQVKRLY